MEIRVSAPNRIDLAGGTTDLYPLYLFMEGGCTVNAAITLYSSVTIRGLDNNGIRIVSEDLKASLEAHGADGLPLDGPLGLINRAVRALPPEEGVEIITANQAPAGSGLGASSALLVALLAGLMQWGRVEESRLGIIDLAANIEAAQIGVPTGKQDHIAAAMGGISLIDFGYRGFARRPSPDESGFSEWLKARLVLSYTGQGRFSGMNNWEITKAFIDDRGSVREKLIQIREVARELSGAVLSCEYEDLPKLVQREWEIRKTLAPGISTPGIEAFIRAAKDAGALASKICGAGGGGCMITLAPPERRDAVEKALREAGAQLMPAAIDRFGLRVEKLKS
ncbi:MAG: GHMP kinase [Desulfomonile tiedjei]|nr:GHMP kinase [Desulfomonile tiedjei]